MKSTKILLPLLATVLMSTFVYANNITLKVNGQIIETDTAPQIINGRTLVPLRVISETLGANVEWDGINKTVDVTKADIKLNLAIGDPIMGRNNEPITLDTPAQIINGRTMVPIRAISECLGCSVYWDPDTKVINLSTDISDDDLSLYAGLAARDAISSITDTPVLPQNTTNHESMPSNDNYDTWISGISNFRLAEVSEQQYPDIKYINRSHIPGYVNVYAFIESGLTGDHVVYIVDDMTENFMEAQNSEGVFNGIHMRKKDGDLYFKLEDLVELNIPTH